MRLWVLVWGLVWSTTAWADIGDPCPNGDECGPRELCYPDEDGDYCTGRCPPAECPEGYFCRGENGVNICVNDPPPMQVEAAIGEPCGPDVEGRCARGLFCVADGDGGYCSRGCFGVGSCPDAYRCTNAGQSACARLVGLPGPLAPCSPEGACAEGLDCVDVPTHQRPICALPCNLEDEGQPMCPPEQMCMGEANCVPVDGPVQPALGDACRDDAAEPTLRGCADGLTCHLASGLESYCTQDPCDSVNRCPDGYGCIEVDTNQGACRRGVPDDDIFSPGPMTDLPVAPPRDAGPPAGGAGGGMGGAGGGGPGDAGGGMGGAGEGGAGAGLVEPPPAEGGEGGAEPSPASEDDGCAQSVEGRELHAIWILALAGIIARRRW